MPGGFILTAFVLTAATGHGYTDTEPAVTSADAPPTSAPVTPDATSELATVAQPKSPGGGSSTATLIAAVVLAAALGVGLTAFLRFRRRPAADPDHEAAP